MSSDTYLLKITDSTNQTSATARLVTAPLKVLLQEEMPHPSAALDDVVDSATDVPLNQDLWYYYAGKKSTDFSVDDTNVKLYWAPHTLLVNIYQYSSVHTHVFAYFGLQSSPHTLAASDFDNQTHLLISILEADKTVNSFKTLTCAQ